MADEILFRELFRDKEFKNLNSADDGMQFQGVVESFMVLVRANRFHNEAGFALMDSFCDYVGHEQVWHLAKMLVPEFRYGLLEQ